MNHISVNTLESMAGEEEVGRRKKFPEKGQRQPAVNPGANKAQIGQRTPRRQAQPGRYMWEEAVMAAAAATVRTPRSQHGTPTP